MARIKGTEESDGKPIEQYTHKGKDRVNNPPVGLVTPETDKETGKKMYSYDPHLDPTLVWAGKAEHTSFDVPTVSLHVHERIDPRTIIEAVQKRDDTQASQGSLFETREENPPLRQAIEFYKHRHNWSNRLIAGDSLLVMNSLLEKEGMAGHVQMVYIDPPYGIKYGSNFQPFVNNREVKDGKDEDLTQEPETLKAFRDTWELEIHSYLTHLRDRLCLAKELLHESGSVFLQISDENVHLVRSLLDEVFEVSNFVGQIAFNKTSGAGSPAIGTLVLASVCDYLIWYAKEKSRIKYHQLYTEKDLSSDPGGKYAYVELEDGTRRRLSAEELDTPKRIPKGAKVFRLDNLTSQASPSVAFEFEKKVYFGGWKTNQDGLNNLVKAKRIIASTNSLNYVRFLDDFPAFPLNNIWSDVGGIQSRADPKIYVVQTNPKPIQRCILMTTDPGDLVLDLTCGSGTTAYVAEPWGRRWITCDTSRVSITLARQRLMTALFDFYQLSQPNEGVSSGFKYKTLPHITLKSVANGEPPPPETLYDRPLPDNSKLRVTGPFTVEAVPAPGVKSLLDLESERSAPQPLADASVTRSGETLRQSEWRDELLKTGIRAKAGQKISFSRVEPLPGTRGYMRTLKQLNHPPNLLSGLLSHLDPNINRLSSDRWRLRWKRLSS
jgi:adenine-specific DNA-methyltransferase